MTPRARAAFGIAFGVATARCIPSLGPGDALVTSTRILAVRAEPAEARPGTKVTFTALVAGPGGSESPSVAWSFCTAPKPLTEDNVVSNACLGGAGSSALSPVGSGPSVAASTPTTGCSVFGPDVGSMGLRPRDPDVTGGYYQPLRAELPGTDGAIALVRIQCDLANADAAAAAAFARAYRDNQNPVLLPLGATLATGADAPLTAIPAGARVTLHARWPASSVETFAYFDPGSQSVTTQREAMQVAWYVSGGTLDTESTGRASDDPATTSDDGWTAAGSGTVYLWVILRDSRGGVAYLTTTLFVTP